MSELPAPRTIELTVTWREEGDRWACRLGSKLVGTVHQPERGKKGDVWWVVAAPESFGPGSQFFRAPTPHEARAKAVAFIESLLPKADP